MIQWVACKDRLPEKTEYYLVWVPKWEGYGNLAQFDIAFWNGSYWGGLNAFASIEDGAPVTHWYAVNPPQDSA